MFFYSYPLVCSNFLESGFSCYLRFLNDCIIVLVVIQGSSMVFVARAYHVTCYCRVEFMKNATKIMEMRQYLVWRLVNHGKNATKELILQELEELKADRKTKS